MISEQTIRELTQEAFESEDLFIVGVKTSQSNQISVFIESDDVLKVSDCIKVSRYIESKLNRDEEDYELTVSSPGLSNLMSVPRLYKKNIGKVLEIFVNGSSKKIKGELIEVSESAIKLETKELKKIEGKKKKQEVIEILDMNYEDIKTAKVEISFK